MSRTTRRSLAVNVPAAVAAAPPSLPDEGVELPPAALPAPSPLRRTRSRTAAQTTPRAQDDKTPTEETDATPVTPGVPTTPGGRRVRTRAWMASGAPASPLLTPTQLPPRSSMSPLLRARRMSAEAIHSIKTQLSDAGDSLKQSCTRYQLLAFEQLPEFLRDNRYIRSGYRHDLGWKQSLESVCHMHNETLNVWTHLVAFMLVAVLLFFTMSVLSPHGVDRIDLDVVLAPATPANIPPQCLPSVIEAAQKAALEAGEPPPALDPACVGLETMTIPRVTPGSDPTEDPLAVLHQLLGDSQEEMLVELASRVQTLLPNLQTLASSLKSKAGQLQDRVLSAMPEQARTLGNEGRLSLAAYMSRAEDQLAELSNNVAELVNTPTTQAAQERLATEYAKLKEHIGEISREFLPPELLLSALSGGSQSTAAKTDSDSDAAAAASSTGAAPPELDLLAVTRNLLDRFVEQAQADARDGLEPAVQHTPGLSVEVRVKPGLDLGNSRLFGFGMPPLPSATSLSSSSPAVAATPADPSDVDAHPSELPRSGSTHQRMDADGGGRSVSTTIGYLSVDLHTRASRPGHVELQLHSYLPRGPIALFLVTAMLCLAFSSCYHLMLAVSTTWAGRFQALDYAGIVLLISGSATPIIYYGFFCAPWTRFLYITSLWVLGAFVFTIVVLPVYRDQRYRLLKTICFVALGHAGVIPVAHFQWHLGHVHFVMAWMLCMGACYLTGAFIYIAQIPERWAPGMFDYIGHSHQLWHLSIFVAVMFHYGGLIHMYEWRMTRVCTADMWS